MGQFKIVEGLFLGQNILEQQAQFGDIPLFVAEVINQHPLRFEFVYPECFVEGTIGCSYAQVFVEHQQRLANVSDNSFGIVAGSC